MWARSEYPLLMNLGEGGLAKAKKGIFGLADSPRRWYLRLNKSVTKLGWVRSELDAALWFLWSADGTTLDGWHADFPCWRFVDGWKCKIPWIVAGAWARARFWIAGIWLLHRLWQKDQAACRLFHQGEHGGVSWEPEADPYDWRSQEAAWSTEHRQLQGLLGSLQWLVSQLRFDQGFPLSTLQSEKPVAATMLKANSLAKKVKASSKFSLNFKPMDLDKCGLVTVSDAALGNVSPDGSIGEDALSRVHSQAAYAILIADENMLAGKEGNFCLIDSRRHRLARVCRSTFAAELMSAEEALDCGEFCRGMFAETRGYSVDRRNVEASNNAIPMILVVDAKDVFDKSTSDTPSYGSQKSLAFTISWIRSQLRRPNVEIKWTATQNMLIDCGTKEMDGEYL